MGVVQGESLSIQSKKNLQSSLTKINDHQSIYHFVREIKIPGFAPREFLTRVVWKKQGQTFVVVYDSTEREDFPASGALVRAESTSSWEYKTLESVGGTHQTRVTLTQRLDLKGSIRKVYVNKGGVRSLMKHFADFKEMKAKSLKMASPLTEDTEPEHGGVVREVRLYGEHDADGGAGGDEDGAVGLLWRVCTGATLSMLDVVMDAVVIVGYMGEEETRGYGYSLLMTLVGSMVLQSVVVFVQIGRSRGRWRRRCWSWSLALKHLGKKTG